MPMKMKITPKISALTPPKKIYPPTLNPPSTIREQNNVTRPTTRSILPIDLIFIAINFHRGIPKPGRHNFTSSICELFNSFYLECNDFEN